jgi:hypothetical protein
MKKINAEDAKTLVEVGEIIRSVKPRLTHEDDPDFWELALRVIVTDFETLANAERHAQPFMHVGACSHWFRPHQTRWAAAGGFAWPSGYLGGSGHNISGLPEFDWSIVLRFDNGRWIPAEKFSSKKQLIMRVALPSRTARHRQAAVHTVCNRKTMFYGFRKLYEQWSCVAVSN